MQIQSSRAGVARRAWRVAGVAVALLCLPALAATAEAGPSVASVLDAAGGAARAAGQFAAPLSGDAQAAATATAAALTAAGQRVREAAKDKTAKPVSELSDKVRPDAERLATVARAVTALLAHPAPCMFQDLDLVVGALKTATATLKAAPAAADADAPRLTQFQFEGLQSTGLAPREGGSVTLAGAKLWTDASLPPDVKLASDGGSALAALTPQRGANADEVKVVLTKELVAQNAGKCLVVTVTPYVASHALLGSHAPKKQADVSLPLCLPVAVPRSFVMNATLAAGSHVKSGTSGAVPVAAPVTRLCANVPREASSVERTFSLTVAPVIGSGKPQAPLYTGAPKAASDMSIFSFEEPAGPYLVHVTYNPTLIGTSQICADVSMPQACGW